MNENIEEVLALLDGFRMCDEMTYSAYSILHDKISILDDLLKTQKPIVPKLIKMYPHDIYECGNSGHRSVGNKDYKAKYCPKCGRAVKWDV